MDELNREFNNYIDEFKKLDSFDKMKEIVDSIKQLVSFIDLLALEKNIDLKYLTSKEVSDLNKDDCTEDDYLEAILVYIEVVKNNIAQYLDSKEYSKEPNGQ